MKPHAPSTDTLTCCTVTKIRLSTLWDRQCPALSGVSGQYHNTHHKTLKRKTSYRSEKGQSERNIRPRCEPKVNQMSIFTGGFCIGMQICLQQTLQTEETAQIHLSVANLDLISLLNWRNIPCRDYLMKIKRLLIICVTSDFIVLKQRTICVLWSYFPNYPSNIRL